MHKVTQNGLSRSLCHTPVLGGEPVRLPRAAGRHWLGGKLASTARPRIYCTALHPSMQELAGSRQAGRSAGFIRAPPARTRLAGVHSQEFMHPGLTGNSIMCIIDQ